MYKELEENIQKREYIIAYSQVVRLLSMHPDFEALQFKKIEILARQNKTADAVKLSGELMNDCQNNSEFLYARALSVFYHGQT